MNCIEMNHIRQAYDELQIIDDGSFILRPYERVGLIGNNGCGKTTLVKIIMGEVEIQSGDVRIDSDLRIGYLRQVNEQTFESMAMSGAIVADETEMQDSAYSGYEVLSKLGFNAYKELDDERLNHLSGGERTKYQLAKLFEGGYDVIILDEPTNHLDTQGRDWLIDQLRSFYGSVLLISHDRHFLDQVTDRTVEVHNGKLTSYDGNYSAYVRQKQHERYSHEQAYAKQQMKKEEIEKEIKKLRHWSEKGHRESTKKMVSGVKFGAKEKFRARAKKKDNQVKSKIKMLEKVDTNGVERPEDLLEIRFRFGESERGTKKVLSVEHVTKAFGERTLFQDAHFYLFRGDRVGLSGANGTGKSTLINMIRGLDSDYDGDIYLNGSQNVAYISQDILDMVTDETVIESMDLYTKERQSRGRQILAQMGIKTDKVHKKIGKLSMGERTRIKIAKLVLDEVDFLILDEPTNHLDLLTKETLEQALEHFDGTILLCTHDRYLMDAVCDKRLVISGEKVSLVENG